jgi:hypothetical protein
MKELDNLIDHFYIRLNNILICKEDDDDLKRLLRAYKYLLERYNKDNDEQIIHKIMVQAGMSISEIKLIKNRLLRG